METRETCFFSNEGTRNEVRMRVVRKFAQEAPGIGPGDDAHRCRYYVERLQSGDRVYLRRPARLHNGFDFLVCVENANYAAPGQRRRNFPKLEDLTEDLKAKKAENPAMYARLYALLRQVYECHDVGDGETAPLSFSSGLPADHILKTIKWLFIEQDIRYWNYSGRSMSWSAVPRPDGPPPLSPFVKWAGGKKQLLEQLRRKMPASFGTYYEPFVGGGALLLDFQPPRAVISDTNEQLINAYTQIRDNTEAVIAAVRSYDAAPCDRDYYLSVRAAYNEKIAAGALDAQCAAMMIWLNKHCFNGLYRVNGDGLFNVPYNNRRGGTSVDGENLRGIGAYLRSAQVDIRRDDFEAACAGVQAGDFVYFDSPYVPVSATANFTDYTSGGFSLADHRRLADLFRRLDGLGAYLVLSNHDVPLVRELYRGYEIEAVAVRRSINRDASKRVGQEVIITNFHVE